MAHRYILIDRKSGTAVGYANSRSAARNKKKMDGFTAVIYDLAGGKVVR